MRYRVVSYHVYRENEVSCMASCETREDANKIAAALNAAEALVAAAQGTTPGPWTAEDHVLPYWGGELPAVAVRYVADDQPNYKAYNPVCMCQVDQGPHGPAGTMHPIEDAAFIAAARRIAAELEAK